jgi:TetR/AcrR family transcriptional repressor of lmrAB and yxaGH operons
MPKLKAKAAVEPSTSTRDRILRAAKQLFQQRGYYAVGTAEILEQAQAPKGSMYHHFPNGKEQIAIEAIEKHRAELIARLLSLEADGFTAAETLRLLAKEMASWLKKSNWLEGTMLVSTAVGSVPHLPKLHTAIKASFDEWREHIGKLLMNEGWSKTQANSLAQTIIAATDGAMIIARVDQDERIVIKVAEDLVRLIERPN